MPITDWQNALVYALVSGLVVGLIVSFVGTWKA